MNHEPLGKFSDFCPAVRQFGQSVTPPGFAYQGFRTLDHDLLIAEAGVSEFILNGQKIDFRRGIAILMRPGDVHEFKGYSGGDFILWYCHFDPVLHHGVNTEYFKGFPAVFAFGPKTKAFISQLEEAVAEQRIQSPCHPILVRSILTGIIAYAVKICSVSTCAIPRLDPLIAGNVEKAISLMENQYGRQLTLSRLAAAVGFSQVHFGRIFKQSTGLTPMQYLIRLRVEKAKKLLLTSKLSIKEIALETGFSSVHFFTATFGRSQKISPGKFRKSERQLI